MSCISYANTHRHTHTRLFQPYKVIYYVRLAWPSCKERFQPRSGDPNSQADLLHAQCKGSCLFSLPYSPDPFTETQKHSTSQAWVTNLHPCNNSDMDCKGLLASVCVCVCTFFSPRIFSSFFVRSFFHANFCFLSKADQLQSIEMDRLIV